MKKIMLLDPMLRGRMSLMNTICPKGDLLNQVGQYIATNKLYTITQ
jgi:hypothetical protein